MEDFEKHFADWNSENMSIEITVQYSGLISFIMRVVQGIEREGNNFLKKSYADEKSKRYLERLKKKNPTKFSALERDLARLIRYHKCDPSDCNLPDVSDIKFEDPYNLGINILKKFAGFDLNKLQKGHIMNKYRRDITSPGAYDVLQKKISPDEEFAICTNLIVLVLADNISPEYFEHLWTTHKNIIIRNTAWPVLVELLVHIGPHISDYKTRKDALYSILTNHSTDDPANLGYVLMVLWKSFRKEIIELLLNSEIMTALIENLKMDSNPHASFAAHAISQHLASFGAPKETQAQLARQIFQTEEDLEDQFLIQKFIAMHQVSSKEDKSEYTPAQAREIIADLLNPPQPDNTPVTTYQLQIPQIIRRLLEQTPHQPEKVMSGFKTPETSEEKETMKAIAHYEESLKLLAAKLSNKHPVSTALLRKLLNFKQNIAWATVRNGENDMYPLEQGKLKPHYICLVPTGHKFFEGDNFEISIVHDSMKHIILRADPFSKRMASGVLMARINELQQLEDLGDEAASIVDNEAGYTFAAQTYNVLMVAVDALADHNLSRMAKIINAEINFRNLQEIINIFNTDKGEKIRNRLNAATFDEEPAGEFERKTRDFLFIHTLCAIFISKKSASDQQKSKQLLNEEMKLLAQKT